MWGERQKQEEKMLHDGNRKGVHAPCGSRERTSNHSHGGEPSSKRHSGSPGTLSALSTPACAGCFRQSISAHVEPRQEVIVAQFTNLSVSVFVARGCAGNVWLSLRRWICCCHTDMSFVE
jgi:hypothetical protein